MLDATIRNFSRAGEMAQWFKWTYVQNPRTHIKPGMAACIYNPGAPTVRCEMETGESQALLSQLSWWAQQWTETLSHTKWMARTNTQVVLPPSVYLKWHTCPPKHAHLWERAHMWVTVTDRDRQRQRMRHFLKTEARQCPSDCQCSAQSGAQLSMERKSLAGSQINGS